MCHNSEGRIWTGLHDERQIVLFIERIADFYIFHESEKKKLAIFFGKNGQLKLTMFVVKSVGFISNSAAMSAFRDTAK
jgi:hypothetical protein